MKFGWAEQNENDRKKALMKTKKKSNETRELKQMSNDRSKQTAK